MVLLLPGRCAMVDLRPGKCVAYRVGVPMHHPPGGRYLGLEQIVPPPAGLRLLPSALLSGKADNGQSKIGG